MHITFLGTGTSHGIPVIGCECPVCTSDDPHNNRMRSSILIEHEGFSCVVDTGQEFRIQAIRAHITHLDAVFYTHDHADHLHGIDDLRVFSRSSALPVYGSADLLEQIHRRFAYIFSAPVKGGGVPSLDLRSVDERGVDIGGLRVQAVPIYHGRRLIYGYRFGNAAYLTDCSSIPDSSMDLLRSLDVLIIGALRYYPHPTHFSVGQAVEAIKKIGPKRGYLTHMSHQLEHGELSAALPESIQPAYDGLRLTLPLEE